MRRIPKKGFRFPPVRGFIQEHVFIYAYYKIAPLKKGPGGNMLEKTVMLIFTNWMGSFDKNH